ncbi:MAG: TRAP transporter large permease [Pseudomonadales bacterium]
MGIAALLMFIAVFGFLLLGYPVALTLAGTALIAALIGAVGGHFDLAFLYAMPNRLFGIMTNETLIAVPLFVLMGVILERSKIAEDLLDAMTRAFSGMPGGLGLAVCLVGMLMAASTGIVGATVVTMGLMALPTMLRAGYHPALATGTICATGTLGQIIPPSIALVLLGDVISSAYQQSQLSLGVFNPRSISVGDLFAGAMLPGLILVGLYCLFMLAIALTKPSLAPPANLPKVTALKLIASAFPPLILIALVLGSIIVGAATPTEAAGIGALGALGLALVRKSLSLQDLKSGLIATTETTAMVFFILIGASLFSLVFRGYGGDEAVAHLFDQMPGGVTGAMVITMIVIFLLGFILDFIEITFVVVPIVGPILMALGVDPIWLGIMIAINLQTSFLTPPFGFALFYLRGVAPPEVTTLHIYRGVLPFIAIQILLLILIAWQPWIATWLPEQFYGS